MQCQIFDTTVKHRRVRAYELLSDLAKRSGVFSEITAYALHAIVSRILPKPKIVLLRQPHLSRATTYS